MLQTHKLTIPCFVERETRNNFQREKPSSMADEQRQQYVAITSEDNTTTITTIEEDDLELSLSLRPLNCSPSSSPSSHHPKNLLEPYPYGHHNQILSKRDVQALRRHEAKLKRDLKRKSSSSTENSVVGEDLSEQRRKIHNLGLQAAAPPRLTWNAGYANGYQGYNGNFGSHNEGAPLSSGSSSGISDNYPCISGPGGNNSDTGSHSSHPHSPLPPTNGPTTRTTTLLQPCSSQLDVHLNGSNPNQSKPLFCSSYSNKTELVTGSRQPSKSSEELTSGMTNRRNEAQTNNDKTARDKDPKSTPRSTIPKEARAELGKPPKPVGLIAGQQNVVVSQMPCVSTTGDGPNGKTITGLLYKYKKGEVSIICVCHGASFSPAGFVEHAGGVGVEFPLRHIRVIPFALG